MTKRKYALVGTGGRAGMFYDAIASTFKETSELVAFCDINRTRMAYANRMIQEKHGARAVSEYGAEEFDYMVEREKPDVVIVTTIDRTHHRYIIRAMELGCDVITEKPLTVDEEKAQEILDAVHVTGRKLRVTFNYRYAPHNTKIREMIMNDTIGKVNSVHFEWLLDIRHGADYFRRWHRDKRNSGGLLVHKSTHHFDLVNFWLGTEPESVFAMGNLSFYGRENAEERGVTAFYQRAADSDHAQKDPFALHMASSPQLKEMYLDAEHEDGYQRDQSVFGDGISIEDTLGVLVQYKNKAILTYSLNAYLPREGFNVVINGSKGRIELKVIENSYVNAGAEREAEGAVLEKKLTVYPMFGSPFEVELTEGRGGHGGGDKVMLEDIFGVPGSDPFNRAASHIDGVKSILTGIAGNISMRTGQLVKVKELVSGYRD